MTLTPGRSLGPYEIVAALGAGGMGEVYRARDTKLGRDVALKILPEGFATDAGRIARFQREAHVLASLNHPHIAAIYGLEDAAGITALVMELVEGEDLSHRIARGPLALDEALVIARQIAEALETAHEQGIVHRDLKPANVKVRADGTVKVLDFGLAKAMDPVGSAIDVSRSPTLTSPAMMTGMGVVLGTVAYMAPEQARGRAADKRSDVWAFGCVLYEMLTGRRPFEGESVTDVIAAVVTREPDWTALPTGTSPGLRRLIARCLKKDPKERLQAIGDARIEIDDAAVSEAISYNLGVTGPRTRWPIVSSSVLSAMLAIALTVLALRVESPSPTSSDQPVTRLELNLPAGVEFYPGNGQSVALSPDGRRVAFVGVLGGVRQIYVRRLDQFEATPLLRGGTENATACFFSPDGRDLGFLSSSSAALKKLSLADGLVVPLIADVDSSIVGAAWGPDNRITFIRAGTLWQVSSTGGPAIQLTHLDAEKGELSHGWPAVAGDGKVILFTVVTGAGRGAAHIEALTVATGRRQVLVDPGIRPLYAPSGHLIFLRNDTLLAAAFDVDRLAVNGQPFRVVEDPALDTTGAPVLALSNSGALMYPSSTQSTSQLVWVSRQGVEEPATDTPRRYAGPRVAPDGHNVLVAANGDLWVQDTLRRTLTRLTSNDTAGNSYPLWTPDGARVVFRSKTGMQWVETDGSGRSEAIPGTAANDYPSSMSPDGEMLMFTRITAATSADVYVLAARGEPRPHAIVTGPAFEAGGQFSPDGRWLAYVSDESGRFEVYVRPYPGPGRRLAVSTEGGRQLRWNRNGKEIFYRTANKMMVVELLSTSPELELSPPRQLFDQRYAYGVSTTIANYDVSADGERFLMVKDESGSGRLNVVLNWADELKRLVPAK